MPYRRFLPKFILIIGFSLLLLVIIFQPQIKDFLKLSYDKAGEYVDYAAYDLTLEPERHRPVSLLQKETELKLYIGEPFKSFSRSDWEEFWNIIYGIFPKTDPQEPGLVSKRRQLTKDEIAYELKNMYPRPFINFQQNHWKTFFEIIFKR
ncbi:MAG: hypothetical protein PHT50_07360 [Candidatus Omnitrophica bacterium]|nr:hypothetical protein [Candidatus Omnitrophota bacterium]